MEAKYFKRLDARLESACRQLADIAKMLEEVRSALAGMERANEPQPDLFSQMGMDPLPEIPTLEKTEPERADEVDSGVPDVPVQAWDGTEVEQERPKRTVRRLENKMAEALTVNVSEPLGSKKGFHQRMNIEKMVVHRTGRSWDAVRVAMNRAVDEQKPMCYLGYSSDGARKLCRFYRREDRDKLIERTIELLDE